MNENKKSQLCWDMRIARTILKRNPTEPAKYCRYCGKLLSEGCDCPPVYEVIDLKKARNTVDSSVAIFANTPEFQVVFAEITKEFAEKDAKKKVPKAISGQITMEGWE